MGMLEDDLSQHPPRYLEQPRKVHFFHDNEGATYGPSKRPFANTLCRMNSTHPKMRTTTDPHQVTCKICRKDRRLRELLDPPRRGTRIVMQREPELVSHFRIEIGADYVEHRFGSPQPLARVRELATHFVNAMTSELP